MEDFLTDVLTGLRDEPRWLPCKYLYDEKGSELFEAICETDDYYVTRADLALHELCVDEISQLSGKQTHLIEFGSGAGTKTERLLSSLDSPRAYSPIEISPTALEGSVKALRERFPDLTIQPIEADYTQDIDASKIKLDPPANNRLVYFPGSTIGNFTHSEARHFLKRMGKIAGDNGAILIGVDLIKPVDILLRAYDDAQGITAQFNKNILLRLQTELDAQLDLDAFKHEARFNASLSRVEMHLVAIKETRIHLGDDCFKFMPGESIHTESSHKYSIEGFQALALAAGLEPVHHWIDPEGLFSMHYLKPTAA